MLAPPETALDWARHNIAPVRDLPHAIDVCSGLCDSGALATLLDLAMSDGHHRHCGRIRDAIRRVGRMTYEEAAAHATAYRSAHKVPFSPSLRPGRF